MVALPPTGALLVFALVLVVFALFVTEALSPDITAIGVLVTLIVLEPYTAVTPETAHAGFGSTPVVTILAMYILSASVRQAGDVDWIGVHLGRFAGGSGRRLLGATMSTTGFAAGVINNTPSIAVFIRMIGDLAQRYRVSPSMFLRPLSYAAMLGGTLTLLGRSLNPLASALSATLLDHPIGMFEFSLLGALVLLEGLGYLFTVGWLLTPARIEPTTDLVAGYELGRNLAQIQVQGLAPERPNPDGHLPGGGPRHRSDGPPGRGGDSHRRCRRRGRRVGTGQYDRPRDVRGLRWPATGTG